MKLIKLQVKTQTQKYPIIIGSSVYKTLPKIFTDNSISFECCLVVIDNKIPKKIINIILKTLKKKRVLTHYFNASEFNKSQKSVDKILDILLKKNFKRNDCLISIGGGITGDVTGFAASIYKRGLKFINIPTTLLSQVDSSIGGKTGINTRYGKNLIGTFYQPDIVISDINFLKTLPRRELICGYGEIFKHALVSNKKFFKFLDKNYLKILNLKSPFIEQAIYKSCNIKRKIVEKDEKEKNIRKILNFGHTFAHAYEATLGYSKKLNHGEAVILGINTASKFSLLNNILKKNEFELIKNHIKKINSSINLKKFFLNKDLKKIISFMMKDKKNTSNKISLVLLEEVGKPIIDRKYDKDAIAYFMKKELTY